MNNDLQVIMSRIGNNLLNAVTMGLVYESWSNETAYSEIVECYKKIQEQLRDKLDLTELSEDELFKLGFKKWEEEDEQLLIPLWAYNFLEDGTELICIDGTTAIKGKDDIDLDVRFGCIPYGIIAKKSE
jgi:hypothetical protein